jgi:hypothetical protein
MPRQLTVTEIRLANITACLTPALTLLNELNDVFGPLFIQPISNTVLSLMSMVQVSYSELPHRQGANIVMDLLDCETE